MRPRGFEPPRAKRLTRPSTLRVYQFRHRRRRRPSIEPGFSAHPPGFGPFHANTCFRPEGHLLCRTHVRDARERNLMADVKLTKRQQEIFDFIKRYTVEKGYPPTVRDIGQAIGLTSSSTVHAHLSNLERLGMLRRDPTKPRAMEVIGDKVKRAIVPSGLPLVGRVAAGTPILAEENIEEYVEVSPLAGGDGGDFVLEVRGDSMKDAGILRGDTVVVRKQAT